MVGIDTAAGAIPAGCEVHAGDLGDLAVRAAALADGLDALLHLATVPGGAAEADPAASRRINIDAMYDLLLDAALLPPGRAVTLPALRIAMGELVHEVARQCGTDPGLVCFAPDAALEAAFAAQPPLFAPAADRAGFAHDGELATFVASALATLRQGARVYGDAVRTA